MNNYCSFGDCFDYLSNCISVDCLNRDGIFIEELLKYISVDDIDKFFKDNHLFNRVKLFKSETNYCGLAVCIRRELYLLDKLQKIGIEIEDIKKLLQDKNIPLGNSIEMIEFFRKK